MVEYVWAMVARGYGPSSAKVQMPGTKEPAIRARSPTKRPTRFVIPAARADWSGRRNVAGSYAAMAAPKMEAGACQSNVFRGQLLSTPFPAARRSSAVQAARLAWMPLIKI